MSEVGGCFSVLSERHCSADVRLIFWNPCVDVVALVTTKGDVILQRLFWKQAWRSSGSGHPVTAAAWSPDGNFFAVAHSNSRIRILDVENGRQVQFLSLDGLFSGRVSQLAWTAAAPVPRVAEKDTLAPLPQEVTIADEGPGCKAEFNWSDFLEKKLEFQTVLVAGSECGDVVLFANASLPLLHYRSAVRRSVDACAVAPQLDGVAFGHLGSSDVHLTFLSTGLDEIDRNRIWSTVFRHQKLKNAVAFLKGTLEKIKDSWEDVIEELDTKMTAYARERAAAADGVSVSDDLMTLMVLGTASPELEQFLLHSLTEKGIKKAKQFLEKSCQKAVDLVTQDLHQAVDALTYHIFALQEMSCLVAEDLRPWTPALGVSMALARKATELRSVLLRTVEELSRFCRWLLRNILQLSEDQVPTELLKATCSDNSVMLMEFLETKLDKTWMSEAAEEGPLFGLDAVAQYWKQGPLSHPLESEDRFWQTIASDRKFSSLLDLVRELERKMEEAESGLLGIGSASVRPISLALPSSSPDFHSDSRLLFSVSASGSSAPILNVFGLLNDSSGLFVARYDFECGKVLSQSRVFWSALTFVDLDLCLPTSVICLMRKESGDHCLIHPNFEEIPPRPDLDLEEFCGEVFLGDCYLTGVDSIRLNGLRGIGCIVSSSTTKLQLLNFKSTDKSSISMDSSAV